MKTRSLLPVLAVGAVACLLGVAWLTQSGGEVAQNQHGEIPLGGAATDREASDNLPTSRATSGPGGAFDRAADVAITDPGAGISDRTGEVRLPEDAQEAPWDPKEFANDRIVWRMPTAAPDAAFPQAAQEFLGTPRFMRDDMFRMQGHPLFYKVFDPAQPDGMLVIDLDWVQLDSAQAYVASGKVEATSHDGSSVYLYTGIPGATKRFAVPYTYHRLETVGLRVSGPDMLPIEAVIAQYGGTERADILRYGKATPTLRAFPVDYTDFRHVALVDADGVPVPDAMLTFDGVQILGRSDPSGHLSFPWPAPLEGVANPELYRIREKYFFISAPGYVPLLLERAELESAAAPVQVVLRAPELLISAQHTVPDPGALKLGLSGMSFILGMGGRDLIPIPDDHPAVDTWEDVFVITHHRGDFDRLQRIRSLGWQEADSTQLWRSNFDLAASFKPGDKFGGFGARKLGEVLGRTPSSSWEAYSKWYYGRWDYDEREGRFDVALPYAGRFLLLVGEYHSAETADYADGALTHALYIDARDPAKLKSKLIIHPKG